MKKVAIFHENESVSQQRNEFIDFAKGLAIVLMVVGHACLEGGKAVLWLHDFIYTFHMPFFMIVSGYLFNEAKSYNLQRYAGRKFSSLYLKFILFNVLLILLNNVLWNIGILNADYNFFTYHWHEYSIKEIAAKVAQTQFTFNNPENTGLVMWFLKDLFVTALIFACLLKIHRVSENVRWLPPVFLVLAVLSPSFSLPVIGIMPTRIFCDLFFYSIGYYLRGRNVQISIAGTVVLMALLIFVATYLGFAELQYPGGRLNVLRILVVGCVGFMWYAATCRMMYDRANHHTIRLFQVINSHAIPIIALHVLVFKVTTYAILGGKFL